MELAKQPNEQNKPTAVERISQESTVQMLAVKQFDKVSNNLPNRIQGTFDLPKVREMILATGEKNVSGFIEFELIKLAERINVSGNLSSEQIEFIATQLMGLFPNETIADFKICFERGASGAYGKIFKLDGVEIGNWMKLYLEEKYRVMENEMMKEKDNLWEKAKTNTDWLKLWQESIEKTDAEGGVKTTSQNMTILNQLRAMTDKETKENGQVKPKYKPYPSTPLSVIEQRELHIQYIRENYDPYTGKQKEGWISEDEWLKKQKQ